MSHSKPYQPKTGARCSCKPGVERNNCPNCEGTGWVINFQLIRERQFSSANEQPPFEQVKAQCPPVELRLRLRTTARKSAYVRAAKPGKLEPWAIEQLDKAADFHECPTCGGQHPPGCCAQDGHGG